MIRIKTHNEIIDLNKDVVTTVVATPRLSVGVGQGSHYEVFIHTVDTKVIRVDLGQLFETQVEAYEAFLQYIENGGELI